MPIIDRIMARILVTGAAGFVGRRLVAELAARHELFALTRDEVPPALASSAEWLRVDLAEDPGSALPARCDAVIHLAQSRHYREFPARADDIFAVNVASTFRLLDYARRAGAEHFVLASSGGVYGTSYERFSEADPVHPLNFYLTSKYVAELMTANYQSVFRTVVLRLFFVYGPGQQGMLVPRLAERVLRGETIVIEGDPGLKINPVSVDDAVRVIEPALALGRSDLFNVAGDEVVTIRELVAQLERVTGRTARLEHAPATNPGDLIGDNTRMKDVLGVVPRVDLEQGLRATVEALVAGGSAPR
jgi:nucleoside-diphosphate-sugar epimerase